jgi:hypothetical protein
MTRARAAAWQDYVREVWAETREIFGILWTIARTGKWPEGGE